MRVTLFKQVAGVNMKFDINKVEGVFNYGDGKIKICKFNSEGKWIEEEYEQGKSFDYYSVYEN